MLSCLKEQSQLDMDSRFIVCSPEQAHIPITWNFVEDNLRCYTDPITEGYIPFYDPFLKLFLYQNKLAREITDRDNMAANYLWKREHNISTVK